jgi:hypothetical protein
MQRSEDPSRLHEEAPPHRRHQSRSPGRWLTKVHRYRVLLTKKWWIPLLGVLLGAGIMGALSWFGPPSFTSVGRMIVSMKLSIP